MKKILLSLAIIFVANFSFAQRRADISVIMKSPVNGTNVRTGVNFTINLTVKNNGPDVVKTTDTLLFVYGVGNTYFPNSATLLTRATDLAVGDSVNFSLPNRGISGGNGGPLTLCSYVALFQSVRPDSVRDNVLGGNNRSCININYSGVGIGEITAINNFASKSYPNPASDKMNIEFTADQNEVVTVEIYDVQGRVIRTFTQNSELSGTQLVEVDVTELNKGIYFYKVIKGTSVSGNKFSVE